MSAANVEGARRVCVGCRVVADCADDADDDALSAHAWGVWGGQLWRAGKVQPRAG